MEGLSPYGQVLPLVIAMLVVVAAVVGFGLKARAGRLRRARAVLEAEAHVIETPPAVSEKPEQTSGSAPPAEDEDKDAEQPPSAGSGDGTGLNGVRPGVGRAVAGADDVGVGAGSERRRVPEPPATGADSALAGLDVGRFTSSLSPTAGRRRPLMPAPRVAAEEPAPPYPGAAAARPDGSSPSSEYRIKANLAAKRYYTDDSPYFARTTAQVWFRTVEDAERAGFTRAGG